MKKLIIILLLLGPIAYAKEEVTFDSECDCENNHGVARWAAKTDPEEPPDNPNGGFITDVFAICDLAGLPDVTTTSPRAPEEEQFITLRGIVDLVRVEADGDVHIQLSDVDGGDCKVVVEIPLGDRWCDMRKEVFSWIDAQFPFKIESNKTWEMPHLLVIKVVGKKFYDVDHAPKDHSNRRTPTEPDLAVWEVHPVMALTLEPKVDD